MTAAADSAGQRWPASLVLEFSAAGSTRLSRCRHRGPLYVQKPFYPEGPDWAHVYLLHPPGGIVSGDSLDIAVAAQSGAGVLLTTPGAARVYRARTTVPEQRQRVRLDVDDNAALEWFPLETIVFNGARAELDTHIELVGSGRCITWEITCFGLPASGGPFQRGDFTQHYCVSRDGCPLFVDHLLLTEKRRRILSGKAGMQGCPVTGFLLAGPCADQPPALLEALRGVVTPADAGAITHVNEFYIGRYLGHSAEQARRMFIEWWKILRPALLQRNACPPRIWST